MNIAQAKQQVKGTIEAYLATDDDGELLLAPSQQRPVFLVGAPGIGKTAIMSQIACELGIGLVSYSMTHHTRQSALGLPFIVHREYGGFAYEASEYTMSEIIASVYDCMRESGAARGILFLDEINCVSETLYPSMLQFLQFKTFGRHAVPRGWVVVCAGNPPEYNRSVHEFDVVTLDRVKKIVVEPDFEAWKTYAADKGVHPAVLTFLSVKQDRFYVMESTLEGKSFVTARGWDDLSDMMRVFERMGKPIGADLIRQYVQNETVALEFAAYYDLFSKYRDDYRIERILAGDADEDVRERARSAAFDERLSLVGLLLDALVGQQREVVERTDVLVALRDDLRAIKPEALAARESISELLAGLRDAKDRQLEASVASGGVSKGKRAAIKAQREMVDRFRVELDSGLGSEARGAEGFEALATLFARESSMEGAVARVEKQLACAFSFLDEVFGDAQELLVFTTELTQRTASARYIAQYGSPSYFAHNANMILSDRQRRLQQRVEELEKL